MKETLIYIVGGLLILTYIACILLAGYTMILVSNVSYWHPLDAGWCLPFIALTPANPLIKFRLLLCDTFEASSCVPFLLWQANKFLDKPSGKAERERVASAPSGRAGEWSCPHHKANQLARYSHDFNAKIQKYFESCKYILSYVWNIVRIEHLFHLADGKSTGPFNCSTVNHGA